MGRRPKYQPEETTGDDKRMLTSQQVKRLRELEARVAAGKTLTLRVRNELTYLRGDSKIQNPPLVRMYIATGIYDPPRTESVEPSASTSPSDSDKPKPTPTDS